MTVSKELEMAIVNDITIIASIDVIYNDGQSISGFASDVKLLPFELTICEHQTARGANPYHYLDFKQITSIVLTYHNGEVKNFN